VGAWGPGVYQNDDALDLRDRWRALRSVGFDAGDVGRRLVDEMGLGDDPDHAASWLALADLLWSAGRLAGDVRKRALRITRDGVDLQRWDGGQRPARARVLAKFDERLRSRMPPPRPARPRHPCDWRPGERIAWRMVDGGTALLRVVGFDPKWGGGGSPIVEVVGANGEARTAVRSLALTSGRRWRGTRFKIGVFEPGTYSAPRVRRIKPPASPRGFAKSAIAPVGIRWSGLDDFLLAGFDLPWPRGAVLRVPVGQSWTWLVVVDALSWSGEPAVVCEILDWHRQSDPSPADLRDADVHRTADTVQVVRSRVVDPRNRLSVANMKRHLGVRDPNERAPVRVCLVGICPYGVAVVGQRRVVVPTSGSNAIEWKHLGKLVEGLMRA
jgi:hypothetical protein